MDASNGVQWWLCHLITKCRTPVNRSLGIFGFMCRRRLPAVRPYTSCTCCLGRKAGDSVAYMQHHPNLALVHPLRGCWYCVSRYA